MSEISVFYYIEGVDASYYVPIQVPSIGKLCLSDFKNVVTKNHADDYYHFCKIKIDGKENRMPLIHDNDELVIQEGKITIYLEKKDCAEHTSKKQRTTDQAFIQRSLTSTTRSGCFYSSPHIEKPSISKSNQDHMQNVIDSYYLAFSSTHYDEFIACFKRIVVIPDIVIPDIPKYEWENLDEVPSYPAIFDHIEKHLLPIDYTCEREPKFLNVCVPARPNYMFVGRPDAAVFPKEDEKKACSALISFEIKRDINKASESQSLLEFIGMIIRSYNAVLHILTDMDNFKFMIYQIDNQGNNNIIEYRTQSYRECKEIIENWVIYAREKIHKEMVLKQSTHIKILAGQIQSAIQKPLYLSCASIKKEKTMFYYEEVDTHDKLIELNKLEETFLNSKTAKLVSDKNNRSGPVYRLEHQNMHLAMKLCHVYSTDSVGNMLINELINESDIYKMLKNSDGPWPKLFYSGYIFNMNYYTIVTEFIEGSHPERGNETHFNICLESLKKLHELNIIHGDPRPPNFILKNNNQSACILDFGFSFKSQETSKKNADINNMKSFKGFNLG